MPFISKEIIYFGVGVAVVVSLGGCTTVQTQQYEVTALTRYEWQVEYSTDPANVRNQRFETFASIALLNRDGQKPTEAVTGPDDRGLWWPALPPRPTLDAIEQRQQTLEKPGTPQLIKQVDYRIRFQQDGKTVTLPTNWDVYREAVKAKRVGAPFTLTLGIGGQTVEKADSP